jgi:GH25 family lysozyme M1 (1,4-beta-N-acetylmuramidase)
MKPFGIDLSRYQGNINWDKVASHEKNVLFAGIRAAISWGYVDPWYGRNFAEARRVGIARAPYHVFYPLQDPIRQAEHFWKTVQDSGGMGELPLVSDVELEHNATPAQFKKNLLAHLKHLEQLSGRKPIIYSRASFIDYYVTGLGVTPPAWYEDYDWWLAGYLLSGEEHPGPVALPLGVPRERVVIHQTSDRGDGKAFGMESYALDYNRWQFDEAHFREYIKAEQPPVNDEITALKAIIATQNEVIAEQKQGFADIREITDKHL